MKIRNDKAVGGLGKNAHGYERTDKYTRQRREKARLKIYRYFGLVERTHRADLQTISALIGLVDTDLPGAELLIDKIERRF